MVTKLRTRDWVLLIGAGVASGIVGRYLGPNWWPTTALTMVTLLIIFPALKHVMGARIRFIHWAVAVGICAILAWLSHASLGL
jgi:uncharacterized membrane protein YjjP (DUF1212 family)